LTNRSYVYWTIPMLSVALVVTLSGNLVVNVVLLTAVALALAVDSVRKVEGQWRLEEDQPILRSRLTHYARIARIEDNTRLIPTATNPFERELLSRKRWSGLSAGELRELGANVREPDAAAPDQAPGRR
jgi:hypothetical protein